MRLIKQCLCFAMFLICSKSLFAQDADAGSWRLLGEKNVGFTIDRDEINFPDWSENVRKIKIKIADGPIKMYELKIHFENGSTQNISLNYRFPKGSESYTIDLDKGMEFDIVMRQLVKIEFTYETKGYQNGRSRIMILGRN